MDKREFLKVAATLGVSVALSRLLPAQLTEIPKTYVYKTAGSCELRADVYGGEGRSAKPVLLWVHGGALIFGSRATPPRWLNPDGRYTVVSIDYRLAPKTKLSDIIEDLRDACRWVRERGPKLFRIDPDRVAVAGESAGGYLSLMSGFSVQPPPKVLLALSGYGNITLPWYTRPSSFYLQQPRISEQEAFRSVEGACVSTPGKEDKQRYRFYLYCRQQGIWPRQVSGHDPQAEPGWFHPYCPVQNVSTGYPPTILIHGTVDTDVPFEESVKMAIELEHFGVKHQFLRVAGGSHCLVADPAPVKAATMQKAMSFVRAQLS